MSYTDNRPAIPLAAGFPTYGEDEWRAAAAKGRRGASGEAPPVVLARRAGAHAIAARPPGAPWTIIERISAADAASTKDAITAAIAGGVTGIGLGFAGDERPLRGLIPSSAAAEIAAHLSDAPAGLQLRIESTNPTVLDAFRDAAFRDPVRVVRDFDPLSALAIGNPKPHETGGAGGQFAVAAVADGRIWHAGGATEELELGATLAAFVGHLRAFGTPERIGVALAADADQFRCVAKFRAIRLLLARVAEIVGLADARIQVHAETAWRMMSVRDPRMNVLRATSAAFAAAVGGADSITVLPFDALAPASDGNAARLARNTQIILAEEAHLARVADPAAGSGTVEAMTATLAEAAWTRFQAIEAEGGIAAAIREGSLLREVAEAREARIASVAGGETRMVGVNAFTQGPAEVAFRRAPVGRQTALLFKRPAALFETATP